jgi:hypothetical protein
MTAGPGARALAVVLAAWCAGGLTAGARADTADQMGLTDLALRIGAENIPTGDGVLVAQVEAPISGNYRPAPGNAEFVGKVWHVMSGDSGASGHATTVGRYFYGLTTSIAPGIIDVWVWEVNHWLTTGLLNSNSGTLPGAVPEGIRIFNHSWVGSFGSTTPDNNALRRADFVMSRDDVLMVVGVNNAGGTNYALMSHNYNGIAVGVKSGDHVFSDTQAGIDGPGRMKPELVAVGGATSWPTALTSGAAALMVETARGLPAAEAANAERAEVVKAVLMAGAGHRAAWTNNPATSGPSRGITMRPLDNVYGADTVNVDRSHLILTSGQQSGASLPASAPGVRYAGWDLAAVGIDQSRFWRLRACDPAPEVSIIATWHRKTWSPFGNTDWAVANFDLILWRVGPGGQPIPLTGDSGLDYFGGGNVVSESNVDNVEHLFVKDLEAGEYLLEVRRLDGLTSFPDYDVAVAWLLPDPGIVGDIDGDCVVGVLDFLAILNAWGPCPGACPPSCPADLNGDCEVGVQDFLLLLANWG